MVERRYAIREFERNNDYTAQERLRPSLQLLAKLFSLTSLNAEIEMPDLAASLLLGCGVGAVVIMCHFCN